MTGHGQANWARSPWNYIFGAITIAGLYSAWLRFTQGLGASTNLNDQFPWGVWIGFDVLCGVGLAAGGFTLVAIVHIFNIEKYKPIMRPAILTAYLGYVLVAVALMFDLGRPLRLWHPLVMWNPHSVMFEVAWCVTLYTTVLSLEFAPIVVEKLGWKTPMKLLKMISVPVVIAGVILSTLHQSSLGTVYLIMPTKLHPLWYTPLLPLFFYISAICVGIAMTIFESWHSSKAFHKQLELPLLTSLGRLLAVVGSFYLVLRYMDLQRRGVLSLLMVDTNESRLFLLEIILFLLPVLLLYKDSIRRSPRALYWCAVSFIFGFVTNRLNVSITGMEASSGASYFPKWTEVAITLFMVAIGFFVFRTAVKLFPVFEEAESQQ